MNKLVLLCFLIFLPCLTNAEKFKFVDAKKIKDTDIYVRYSYQPITPTTYVKVSYGYGYEFSEVVFSINILDKKDTKFIHLYDNSITIKEPIDSLAKTFGFKKDIQFNCSYHGTAVISLKDIEAEFPLPMHNYGSDSFSITASLNRVFSKTIPEFNCY